MGFTNQDLNISLLERFHGNIKDTIEELKKT